MKTKIYSELEQKLLSQKKNCLEQKQALKVIVICIITEVLIFSIFGIFPELNDIRPIPELGLVSIMGITTLIFFLGIFFNLPLGRVLIPTEEEVKVFAREELREMKQAERYVLLFILLCEDDDKAKKAQEDWDLAVKAVKELVGE